ncbi:hypothetical protein EH223_12495 [candidate division KSB1 bacterium]|nr:hypothetical protein [candidate division KSB1 bacterium]RQW02447.1 MAG: hypothetical protein EH223_12495 [candidate division KSB1 bacterium]
MLDLTGLTKEQQDAFLHTLDVAADNPIEQMKMNFLLHAISFKEWIENNATVNKKELQLMWNGLENAVNRDFKEAQRQLALKCNIKFID